MKTSIFEQQTGGHHERVSRILTLLIVGTLILMSPLAGSQIGQLNPKNTIHPTAKKVQQIYTAEIGVREKQVNAGAAVEKYLAYVNLPKGKPWCAAFVCWVFGEAGVRNPRTGWTPGLFRSDKVIWEREPRTKSQEPRFPQNALVSFPSSQVTGNRQQTDQGTRIKEQRRPQNALVSFPSSQVTGNRQLVTPRSADIFALFFPEKNRIAHAGFVDQWDGTWLISVEGNTNLSGSREGDGVYRKRRLVRSTYKVARYVN